MIDGQYTDAEQTGGVPAWIGSIFALMRDVPFHIWGAIVWQESGFNPLAHNTGTAARPEDSVGLLQLNRKVPKWGQYPVSYLQNPINNITLGGPDIRAAYLQYGDDIANVAVHSGHPGAISPSDPAVKPYIQKSNALKGKDPVSAVGEILKGLALPAIPSAGDIGAGIWEGLTAGLTGAWAGLRSQNREQIIDTFVPPAFVILGGWLIIWGVTIAALRSGPAQAGASAAIASGNPYAAAAGAGVKAIGGDSGRAAAGQVRVSLAARQRARRDQQRLDAATKRAAD